MAAKGIHRLGRRSRIRLPDVDEILDAGYAIHAADDAAIAGTEAQQLARLNVRQFMAIRPRNSTEAAYLAAARGIALSQGRGLAKRKEQWRQALRTAEETRSRKLDRIQESRKSNGWLSVVWKLLGPAILGLLGFLTASLISLIVPVEISATTTHSIPSFAMGLLFVFIGRAVSFAYMDWQRNIVESEYKSSVDKADLAYELGKITEYRLYRARLCEAWKQYTGEDYPQTVSYESVMLGDIETRKSFERHQEVFNRNSVWLLRRIGRILRRKPRKQPDGGGIAEPVPAN